MHPQEAQAHLGKPVLTHKGEGKMARAIMPVLSIPDGPETDPVKETGSIPKSGPRCIMNARDAHLLDPFRFVSVAVAAWMNQRHLQAIEYLREENRVLREQLGDHLCGSPMISARPPRFRFGVSFGFAPAPASPSSGLCVACNRRSETWR